MAKTLETKIEISGQMDASVSKAISSTTKNLAKLDDKVDAAYKDISKLGKAMTGKVAAGFKSLEKVALTAGAALTTAVAGAATYGAKKLVELATECQKATTTISSGTGAAGAELDKLNEAARNIWKSGLGENMQEVAEALVNVKQTSGLAGAELENATKYGIMLRDTFDMEINETSRTASALMKNFGITAQEAYGLIATGAQKGANKNGDMLDTLNEYSVHYKSLGLNAEQFVTSLVKGAEAGSWSVDKVGDAVKEFTIRSKDGSKKSLEAFEMLGLHGVEMTRAFANGGDEAAAAFQKTVKALQAIKDPVKQNAAGVMLFGTMFEDLEAGVLDTMASMSGASVDATGSLKELESVRYSDISTALSGIGRSLKAQLMPAAETIAEVITKNMPTIQAEIAKLQPYIADLSEKLAAALPGIIQGIVEKIPAVIERLKDAARWLNENKEKLLEVATTIGKVYLAIKGIQAGIAIWQGMSKAITAVKTAYTFLAAAQTKQKIAEVAGNVAKGISTAATWAQVAATWALNGALAVLTSPIFLIIAAIAAVIAIGWLLYKNWDTICAALKTAWEAVSAAIGSAWEWVCAGLKTAWEGVKGFFSAAVGWLSGIFTGLWDGVKNAAETVFQALPAILKSPINAIISLVNGAIDAINSIGFTIPDWIPGIGGKAFNLEIPKLPMLAAGGWTNGPSIAGEAGTELVTSFDPAHRAENQRNLATAAEMLGMYAAPKEATRTTNYNLGGITFSPVIKTGDSANRGDILTQLRACMPDVVDMIEAALKEREAHRYA